AATVADLGDGHHVQGVVDPPVPGPGQAVADLVAGGDVDRGGAVIAGEGVLGGEPCHVADLGENPPGDHRPDAVEGGQGGAGRGDQGGDLDAEVLDPGVEGAEDGEVVAGDLQADRCGVAGSADGGELRLGFVRRQRAAQPPDPELRHGAVETA